MRLQVPTATTPPPPRDAFIPATWLRGPHAQTLGARFTRSGRGLTIARERLELPDGDFLDLDWPRVAGAPPAGGLIVVLHGLEGSARSGYALQAYRALAARGLAAVGLNFRSCGGELNRLPRLYHSGETGDLGRVLDLLAGRFPGRPLGALGFSLGGNVLLKYLGEVGARGGAPRLAAAAAVSVPYDLAAGAAHLERGFARIYMWRLLRLLKRKVRGKRPLLEGRIDVSRALAATTFRVFDDAATAPLHGFAGADDYYARSSSAAYLGTIAVPTHLIHALDDPFLPAAAVPRDALRENSWLDPRLTLHGGHVGFVSGPPWRRHYWAEANAAAFLADRLGAPRRVPPV